MKNALHGWLQIYTVNATLTLLTTDSDKINRDIDLYNHSFHSTLEFVIKKVIKDDDFLSPTFLYFGQTD